MRNKIILAPLRLFSPLIPGLLLCAAISIGAQFIVWLQRALFSGVWLENLVLAILLGMLIRSLCPIPPAAKRGIDFAAKTLLEIAVVCLGASVSFHTIQQAGTLIFLVIAVTVILVILLSYLLGRLTGLSSPLALLVACGNAICGNSAIAAVAPVIRAKGDDVAAAIAFTAALGVLTILLLPLAIPLFSLSLGQYGFLAGMTVYAVPQVLAATAPISPLSTQIATFVKLLRVLFLGPIVFILAIIFQNKTAERPAIIKFIPPFIIGFITLMTARSLHLIPTSALAILKTSANLLTVFAMAGLGLGVDIRTLKRAGGRVVLVTIASLALMATIVLLWLSILPLNSLEA